MIVRQHTIVDGVNLVLTAAENLYDIICLTGTPVLTSNWAVAYSGTPKYGETFNFRYTGKITLGGNHITILGASVPDEWASKDCNITAMYNGISWDVVMMPDFDENAIIITDHLVDLAVTTPKIMDAAVTTTKMGLLSVDNTILAADSVITSKILDKNVTYAKMQDVAANSLVGNFTAGALAMNEIVFAASTFAGRLAAGNLKACSVAEMQTALAIQTTVLNNALIWIGSADNLATGREMSKDATLSNTGVLTITNDAITTVKVLDSNITEAKLGSETSGTITKGGVACQVMSAAGFKALLTGADTNLFPVKAGDKILDIIIHVSVAGTVAAKTIDIGYDANVGLVAAGVADDNGLIEAAPSNASANYSCLNVTYDGAAIVAGAITVDVDGYITVGVTDSTALNLDATLVAYCMMYYIPK